MAKFRFLSFVIIVLSCVCTSHAQDSFFNPYSFRYHVEFSSELPEDTLVADMGRLVVTYDSEQRKQCCTLTYRDSVRYKGNIIDMQLYQKRQDFMLENFFGGGSHAKLTITRDEDGSNQKVALIYYANPKEDPLPDKTCICLLLSDVLL